jgi:GNAT superfamily N-acetyltransferase
MTDSMTIRPLHPTQDLPAIAAFQSRNAAYFLSTEGRPPDAAMAASFFSDDPPGCDRALSHRFGLFIADNLAGLAALSFGFPDASAAYLALMILSDPMRGKGYGTTFLAHAATLARARHAAHIYLAVRDDNLRGKAFWCREGFTATGLSGVDDQGHLLHRLVKPL